VFNLHSNLQPKGFFMNTSKPFEQSSSAIDNAAKEADHALNSLKSNTSAAIDGFANGLNNLNEQAAPMLRSATEQASAMAHRGVDAVRDGSVHMREAAQRVSDGTVSYIKGEPVKSMLIAAATGAALMAMVSLMSASRSR
jgi:ElaB/YqjD/DUF883 family membrane-anchored ribosome-binding protein